MLKSLSRDFNSYFWDTDPKKIDLKKNSAYVIERILEWGDSKSIKWLEEVYGTNYLKKIIKKTRRLSRKSANFYAHFYGISPKSILCLQEGYLQKQKAIWNR